MKFSNVRLLVKDYKKCFVAVMIVAGVLSCDKVNKPYRIVGGKAAECDTPSFPALDDVMQKYLLEDYTGHTCTNCPLAHKTIDDLTAQMGDTLIVIAIHAGSFAKPEEGGLFSADFRTEAGDAYNKEFNITAYPSGMINRMLFNGKRTVSYSNWKNTLAGIARKPADIGIQIMLEDNGENTCIFVKTSLLSDVSETLRLCVFITENNIISPQKNGSKVDTDYVHNHVLRTSLTPVWGDNIEISAKNESLIKGYSVDFKGKDWKKENCYIVVFVYNLDTKEILQVEEIKAEIG